MKQNSIKSITAISVAIIAFCGLSVLFVLAQGFIGFISPENVGVIWSEEIKGFQMLVALGRMLGGAAFFGLITAFLIKSIKGLKNGVLFPASNVPVLYFSALALFIYNFCYANGGILTGADHNLLLDTDDITISLIIVVFAMIYKIAVKISDENSLTI
ncbi:MAG: DUF2975 domain-containing protein [Bacteroidales bacterium]|nr:DUF2975 domain-containing protein [Bacteroidales bacterium]